MASWELDLVSMSTLVAWLAAAPASARSGVVTLAFQNYSQWLGLDVTMESRAGETVSLLALKWGKVESGRDRKLES